MDFFGIGGMEIVILLVVALLVFGPARIVGIGRTLGRFSRRVSQTGRNFTKMLEEEYDSSPQEKDSHNPPEKSDQEQI
ncbi:twin-arginine translocase TatA/TatE family subunit [Chloroflexota bacterium]